MALPREDDAGAANVHRFPVNLSLGRFLLTLGLSLLLATLRREVAEVPELQRGLYAGGFALLAAWALLAGVQHWRGRGGSKTD
eukprot:jgi/Tetstr1/437193/TSEL_002763.t1